MQAIPCRPDSLTRAAAPARLAATATIAGHREGERI